MKVLLLALLLTNLGYLGWHFLSLSVDEKPVSTAQPASSLPRLKLVRGSTTMPEPVTDHLAVASPPTQKGCVKLGPFDTHDAARSALAGLDADADKIDIVSDSITVADTYRVYFPPFPTEAKARTMMGRLHNAGIKDVYVMLHGKQKYAVSVGVFSEHEGAIDRQKHVKKLGFDAVIAPRKTHQQTRYWLATTYVDTEQVLKDAALPSGGNYHVRECPALQRQP